MSIYAGSTWSVDVGASDEGWLVVWDALGVLRATRIDREGHILDSPPMTLTDEVSEQSSWSIASDGRGYVVLWTHQPYFTDRPSIRATRIDHDGTILDAEGIVVSTSPSTGPEIIHDGTDDWMGWTTEGNRVETRRLSPDGTLGPIRSISNEGVLSELSRTSAGVIAVLSKDGLLYSALLR